MKGELYNKTSSKQLTAHSFAQNALDACVKRVVALSSGMKPFVATDMGCASGANSLNLVKNVVGRLRHHGWHGDVIFYHSDLPQTDFNAFTTTFSKARSEGAIDDRIFITAMGRSFYETLLPERFVQLHLSYISLHWMNKVPCTVSGLSACVHDDTVPAAVLESWQKQALEDLVLYFQLRAKELVDGGECLTLMVAANLPGRPAFMRGHGGSTSVFADALAMSVKAGHLSQEMAVRATIPYFLRDEADVKAALDAVPELELMEVQRDMLPWAGGLGTEDGLKNAADLAWAIHANCLQYSMGASNEQMEHLRLHLNAAWQKSYSGKVMECPYMYVVVKRRRRDVQSSVDL